MIVLYTKYSTISCSRSQFLTFVIIAVLLLLFLFNVLLFWLQQWNWAYDISIQWNKNTRNHMWVYMNSMHRLTNKSLLVFYFTFFFLLAALQCVFEEYWRIQLQWQQQKVENIHSRCGALCKYTIHIW